MRRFNASALLRRLETAADEAEAAMQHRDFVAWFDSVGTERELAMPGWIRLGGHAGPEGLPKCRSVEGAP